MFGQLGRGRVFTGEGAPLTTLTQNKILLRRESQNNAERTRAKEKKRRESRLSRNEENSRFHSSHSGTNHQHTPTTKKTHIRDIEENRERKKGKIRKNLERIIERDRGGCGW